MLAQQAQHLEPVDAGQLPTLQEAWLGALAYTLQIYFDFSGYSDMAIGIALLVVLVPPLAFGQSWDKWVYRGLALLLRSTTAPRRVAARRAAASWACRVGANLPAVYALCVPR